MAICSLPFEVRVMSGIDRITAEMLSKAFQDVEVSMRFQEEFIGMIHAMILDLYKQTNIQIPEYFVNYKFINKSPWSKNDHN